jgi:hypothetical protein
MAKSLDRRPLNPILPQPVSLNPRPAVGLGFLRGRFPHALHRKAARAPSALCLVPAGCGLDLRRQSRGQDRQARSRVFSGPESWRPPWLIAINASARCLFAKHWKAEGTACLQVTPTLRRCNLDALDRPPSQTQIQRIGTTLPDPAKARPPPRTGLNAAASSPSPGCRIPIRPPWFPPPPRWPLLLSDQSDGAICKLCFRGSIH